MFKFNSFFKFSNNNNKKNFFFFNNKINKFNYYNKFFFCFKNNEVIKMKFKFIDQKANKNILFLHALLGSHKNWINLSKELKPRLKKFNFFLVDIRNHGKSEHSNFNDYASIEKDILFFLKENNLNKINIIGHSLGAKCGMYFSLKNQNLVEKLVIIDASPTCYLHNHNDVFEAINKVLLTESNLIDAKKKLIKETNFTIGEISYILRNIKENKKKKKLEQISNIPILHKTHYQIMDFPLFFEKPFKKKTLFIASTESNRLEKSTYPSVFNFFPNANIETLEGGHFAYSEHPSKTADLIENYFKQK